MMIKEEGNPFTTGFRARLSRRAQTTIFIIIAVIIVAAVAALLIFKGGIKTEKVPSNLVPPYNNFLYCLEEDTRIGINLLETYGGYIELPEFEPGSSYMPFSSQLTFLGNRVPYWYYISGNNIQKEQVPTKKEMEEQLSDFIEKEISNCFFNDYYEQGFGVFLESPEAEVEINDGDVQVNLKMDLVLEKGNDTALIREHSINVKSELGALYESAKNVYEKEQEELFLEEYGIDTLRLYAPVDGTEITCSPQIWNADEIFEELRKAIEANTLALKAERGDYSLKNKENEYFVIEGIDKNVRFVNSGNFTYSFEVSPSEGNILIAEPVGAQQALGVLGFCYVPYHFVYNLRYPVLIQVYDDTYSEIFQFPVAVVIQGNKPREALDAVASEFEEVSELCKYKNTETEVRVYDSRLNPVNSNISYRCLGTECSIGETENGVLKAKFPQCVNGYIIIDSEGFRDMEYLYSTTEEGYVEIFLDKLYELELNLKVDGKDYNKGAIIHFSSDKSSDTIVYPDEKGIELSEGQYEISVQTYENSSIRLEKTTYEECVEVPQSGLGGIFGLSEEKCFEVELPAQTVSNALSGGGTQEHYILESDLKNSEIIEINAESLPKPEKVEDLQENYLLFENKGLDIWFK